MKQKALSLVGDGSIRLLIPKLATQSLSERVQSLHTIFGVPTDMRSSTAVRPLSNSSRTFIETIRSRDDDRLFYGWKPIAKQPKIRRMDGRGSRQAAGGQARGIIVGSLIALGWWVYGTSMFAPSVRLVAVAAAAVLSVALFVAAVQILRRVDAMPPAAPAEMAASKRVWRWFWLNLIGEIILLNIAISLLGAPDLRVYWIAAISGVVGLHFLPMAVFFRTRSYWFVGAAMMAGSIICASVIARFGAGAADVGWIEALANALILWSSLGSAAVIRRAAMSEAA